MIINPFISNGSLLISYQLKAIISFQDFESHNCKRRQLFRRINWLLWKKARQEIYLALYLQSMRSTTTKDRSHTLTLCSQLVSGSCS